MGTTKTATARALIEPEVKKEAESLLKEMRLSVSSSIELFYRQVVARRGVPFELHVPNETTMKAIRNSRAGKGKRFSTRVQQAHQKSLD
jgi:DNA-damage-inducible protein J